MGALNLYSRKTDAFDDRDVAVGWSSPPTPPSPWTSAQHDEDLEKKADSRDVIGMAKGIVMAQQRVSDEQAFDILRPASQRERQAPQPRPTGRREASRRAETDGRRSG